MIEPPGSSYAPDPKWLELGDGFADVVTPARFPTHRLRFRNDRAAATVGLAELSPDAWQRAFARFEPLAQNVPEPLALRYHGHQFGVYNPHLGDGRGFLYAQLREGGPARRLLDLATKGSGTTPWSRGGDGRLTLKGGVREVLAAEMLEALGAPTSRAFSLFETGESLFRGDEPSPTRSSVLVRLGHSHVRFGTFQRLARLEDRARMRRLVDYCIETYFPDLAASEDPPLALLGRASAASAALVARWMAAGFCHGVLNTDNMTITGESFDYGPWRFVPRFDPDFVAAYFDGTGLYAFGRQPAAVEWSVARLSDALRLIAPSSPFGSEVAAFGSRYEAELARATVRRLGLLSAGEDLDGELARATWALLEDPRIAFERFFFDVFGGRSPKDGTYAGARWRELLRIREAFVPLPALAPFDREGPCTMTIDDVEAVWSPIDRHDDWTAFEQKLVDIRDAAAAYGF